MGMNFTETAFAHVLKKAGMFCFICLHDLLNIILSPAFSCHMRYLHGKAIGPRDNRENKKDLHMAFIDLAKGMIGFLGR